MGGGETESQNIPGHNRCGQPTRPLKKSNVRHLPKSRAKLMYKDDAILGSFAVGLVTGLIIGGIVTALIIYGLYSFRIIG